MSPDEIARVTRTWHIAAADREALVSLIAAGLPGPGPAGTERAEWIVQSVSSLAPVLDRPTAFVPAAAELIALRFPLTLDELAEERDALLHALEVRCGRPSEATAHAWELAFGLFAEIVCAIALDPFGFARDEPAVVT